MQSPALSVHLIHYHLSNFVYFINYIITNPDTTYEFKLPKSEFNEDFMRFTKDFFMKHIKKCNVKFVIVK